MQIGSIVQLTNNPEAGQDTIARFTDNGFAQLKRGLAGNRFWNVGLLTEVRPALIDKRGRRWWLLGREDGSICLYWTKENNLAHNVVWDSLDGGDNG